MKKNPVYLLLLFSSIFVPSTNTLKVNVFNLVDSWTDMFLLLFNVISFSYFKDDDWHGSYHKMQANKCKFTDKNTFLISLDFCKK